MITEGRIYLPAIYKPEILEPGKILVTSARPFGVETVYAQAPVGLSLSQILWNGPRPVNLPYQVEAWIDGKPVPCEVWDETYPHAGALVAFKALPTGGGLRTILQILVMIIAVAVSLLIPGGTVIGLSIGGTVYGVTGTVAGALIGVVGNLLVNALCPPVTPKHSDFSAISDTPTQWISGAQNSINKWGSIPVVLGTHRTTPFYGAKPYTEIVGNDQYVRCLFVIGYGPLQLTDLKIGEASIDTFQDVEVEVRSGYAGDDPITLIPDQVDELGLQALLVNEGDGGTWNSRTTEADCDQFSVDWSFPGGLVIIGDNGVKIACTVSIEMRYRKDGVGDWTYIGDNLSTPASQKTFQSAWTSTEGLAEPTQRDDFLCMKKDTGATTIFQSAFGVSAPPPPLIDDNKYYQLARVTIFGSEITNIEDLRDPGYVTGCAVTLSAGLVVDIASGVILDVTRLTTTAASTEAVRRTLMVIPPERGQYEVQLRRISPDSEYIQISDKVYWIVLRSVKHEHPINFPHPLALVALRIKATDQLSGAVDTFNCVATSIVKDHDTAPLDVELLTNGDMELDANWVNHNTPTTNERSGTQKHWGTYSRKFISDAANDGIKQTGLSFIDTEEYHLGFWIYPIDLTRVGVFVNDGDSNIVDESFTGLIANEWNYIETTCTSGHTGATGVVGVYDKDGDLGTYYVDDVSFKKILPPAWVLRPTNNPASMYRYVLQGIPNSRPQTDDQLDLTFFETFHQWCVDSQFAYNAVTASAKSVFELCTEICSAGRASPQRVESKWAGIIDKIQAQITGHYTPHNSWNLEFGGAFPQLPHGMRVAFIDETHNYEQQERIVYDDGYNEENATLFESAAQQGVTDPDQIFKLWRYNIACMKLRPFPFSFMIDWEHLTNTRGDLVRCSYYELSGQLFTGRLKSVDEVEGNHVLVLDNPVMMSEGKSYAIRIRETKADPPRFISVTGDVINEVGETDEITIDGLLVQTPLVGDLFQFGELDAESIPAIISKIEPVDKLCAKITCVDYNEGIYSADTELIPEWNPVVTTPSYYQSTPAVPEITNVVSDESVVQRDPGGRFKFRIVVNFRYTSSTKINAQYVQCQYHQVVESGEANWTTLEPVSSQAGVLYIPDVQEGIQYQIRIRSLSKAGSSSEWSTPYLETVVGRTSVPPNVTGLDHSFTENGVLFTWDRLTTIDVNSYQLKHGGATWEDATPLSKVDSDSYEWGWRTAGNYIIRIKAVDFLGLESLEDTTLLMTITYPQKPTNLRSQTIHNQVLLFWECVKGSFPIKEYQIYKDAVLVGTVGGTFISMFESAGGTYVYTVLPVDTALNEGESESISVYMDEPFGLVLGQEEGLTLSGGEFDHALYDPDIPGILMPVDIASSYDDFMDDWASWQLKIDDGYPRWLQPSLAAGEWLSDTIDIGEVIPSSRIILTPTTTVLVAGCTVTFYIQYSLNGEDWTEVEGTQTMATNFRYFRVRITATQAGDVGLVKLS